MMFRKHRGESENHDDVVGVEEEDVIDDVVDEHELVMAQASSGVVGFIGGILVGTLVGAGVALLLAPERGAVTRRRIRSKLEEASDDALDRFEDLRDDASRRLQRGRRRLRRLRSRTNAD